MRSNIKSWITFFLIFILSIISSLPAIRALSGYPTELTLSGLAFFGDIRIGIDALSGWFILIINFTMLTGSLYSIGYMASYAKKSHNITLHWIVFVLFHFSMLLVCMVQNGLAFLVVWEIMSLSSFFLVILEHEKTETIKAGINYLIQMHLSMVFLTLGVIWLFQQTGSYDLAGLAFIDHSVVLPLFLIFFLGFAFKAGFNLGIIPLHTWLPHAHPAAPSHISAIMSGVMIKLGIFGIFRIIQLFPLTEENGYKIIGWGILTVSLASGLYGVMLAIIQHNLKKLLAYHSIENIGIIGIGIGIGCLGLGYENSYLAVAGFAGALLHSLNHSLFKSLLFYAAGNVYLATHTINIESLGGIFKKMPQTAVLFLLAALAICGFPPFNGFISEFIIYSGLYQGIIHLDTVSSVMFILVIFGLALIGGLAMLCFTKAFGIVFLGSERSTYPKVPREAPKIQLLPMYLTGAFILTIGLFPAFIFKALNLPVSLLIPVNSYQLTATNSFVEILQNISRASIGFILIAGALMTIRHLIQKKRARAFSETWGCGYVAPSYRMQYTANSFVRKYRKLAGPVLSMRQKNIEINEIFPSKKGHYETHPSDKLEEYMIQVPLRWLERFLSFFRFIQNGQIQYYLFYGLVFLIIVMIMSLIPEIF